MAITQITVPETFRPAYSEILYVFSSDNTSECDFQYIADLFVNGVFAIRIKAFPDTNDLGYFRVDELLQDYLSHDYHDSLTGWAQNKNSICSYYIQVRERYNTETDCTGAATLSSVLYTTATRYAFNATVQFIEQYDEDEFLCNSTRGKFLTNAPNRIKLPAEANFNLAFLQDPNDPVNHVIIETFDRFNNKLGTYQANNSFSLSSPDVPEDYHLSLGIGPAQVNSFPLALGSQPVYHSNVHWYRVYLSNNAGDRVSELREFEIDNRCSAFDKYRLWWLNRLGGCDSFTFPLKRLRNVQTQRTSYEKVLPRAHSTLDRGETTASVDARDAYIFNSNWMSEQEGIWIEELFTSPEVILNNPEINRIQPLAITGAVHNSLDQTADFVLPLGVILEVGTPFTYIVDDGSPIGMANSGSGTITGYDSGAETHNTDVPSTINSGSNLTGTLTARHVVTEAHSIPLILTSTAYEEKNSKIRYSIEARPSFKKNIQKQ